VKRRRPLLVVVAALALAPGPRGAMAAPQELLGWWTTDALHKVRPADAPGKRQQVELFAARNEFEPFQLVLRSDRPVAGVDVDVGPLVPQAPGAGVATTTAVRATVYLERYVQLRLPSSLEGAAGEWPDPLLPRVDTYSGERRKAFPFDLAAGRNQPLWIELYVPPETPPGDYRGAARVTVQGALVAEVPFALHVWPFALPSTSSLRTTFGFSAISAAKQHRGAYGGDEDLYRWTDLYGRAALRHRLSLHGGSMVPPPATFAGDRATVDWRSYDAEVGPFLDGLAKDRDGGYLPGARFTAIDLRVPTGLSDAQKIAYWRAWAKHFRERRWMDRLFYYVMDEPEPQDYPRVLAEARLAHQADPGIATLLTEQWVPSLAGAIDLWVPLVNLLDAKPDGSEPDAVARATYAPAEAQGARLWWYQSCSSHGCDTVGGKEFAGWPSYVIDTPAVGNRIMPWLAFAERIGGELYYNTVESYTKNADAWNDPATHGGNGDGTLFYPGTPARVGGTTDLPIESLRLKLIREGLEDYEYLTLLAKAGREDQARAWAQSLAPHAAQWEHDPARLYALRRRIGEAVAAALARAPSATSLASPNGATRCP